MYVFLYFEHVKVYLSYDIKELGDLLLTPIIIKTFVLILVLNGEQFIILIQI